MKRRVVRELTWKINDISIRYVIKEFFPTLGINAGQQQLLEAIVAVFEGYQKNRLNLMKSIYQHCISSCPDYYREPRIVTLLCCPDGVIVRYERKAHEVLSSDEQQIHETVLGGWSDK